MNVKIFHDILDTQIKLFIAVTGGMFMSKKSSSTGENLRRCREACALSQQQVADALNINRTTYTKYETGDSDPALITLVKLAAIYNVSPLELLPVIDEAEHQELTDRAGADSPIYQLAKDERGLVAMYRALSKEQKREAYDQIAEINKKDS